jgi:hypothetical protein
MPAWENTRRKAIWLCLIGRTPKTTKIGWSPNGSFARRAIRALVNYSSEEPRGREPSHGSNAAARPPTMTVSSSVFIEFLLICRASRCHRLRGLRAADCIMQMHRACFQLFARREAKLHLFGRTDFSALEHYPARCTAVDGGRDKRTATVATAGRTPFWRTKRIAAPRQTTGSALRERRQSLPIPQTLS